MFTILDSSDKIIPCDKYRNGSRLIRNFQDGSESAILDSPQGSKSTGLQIQYTQPNVDGLHCSQGCGNIMSFLSV